MPGGQATGKLTARIEVSDTVALRGAMSTGFRAPSLSQRRFNSILFVGSEQGLTTTFSANEGTPRLARLRVSTRSNTRHRAT